LKDNLRHVEVSKAEAAEVAVEVVVDNVAKVAVEEVALHMLPMVKTVIREKDALELKVAKKEEVAADVVVLAEVVKMVMHPDVEVTAEVLRDKSTKMENKSKCKRKDKPSEESPEKVPTLMTASQELAVERETNRSLVVAVDNGEMPNKTSPLKKVRKRPKVKKPSPKKRPRLKKSSKLRKLKNPMYSCLLMIT